MSIWAARLSQVASWYTVAAACLGWLVWPLSTAGGAGLLAMAALVWAAAVLTALVTYPRRLATDYRRRLARLEKVLELPGVGE